MGFAACAKFVVDDPDASGADASSSDANANDSSAPDVTKPVDGSCAKPTTKCSSDAGDLCVDLTLDKNHCAQCNTVCTTADAGGMAPGTGNPDPGIFDAGYDGGIG